MPSGGVVSDATSIIMAIHIGGPVGGPGVLHVIWTSRPGLGTTDFTRKSLIPDASRVTMGTLSGGTIMAALRQITRMSTVHHLSEADIFQGLMAWSGMK